MYKKFCILLFVTIFCNGVTHSSPAKVNSRDLISKEQEASTNVSQIFNHKVESNTTALVAGVPLNHKVESNTTALVTGVPLNQTAVVKTPSNHSVVEDKSIPRDSAASELQNVTQNSTTTINATVSNSTNITSVSTAPTPAVPVTPTTDLPLANISEMSRPVIAGNSATPVSTLAAGTTIKAPVTMPTAVTPKATAAVSTTTESVHLEHNSSKAQENRFDGASFVGGIVLTIGLTAIGFIAFKYYKSESEAAGSGSSIVILPRRGSGTMALTRGSMGSRRPAGSCLKDRLCLGESEGAPAVINTKPLTSITAN